MREEIARIHIDDIVARGLRQTFVHRIVDAVIGFREDDYLMPTV